MTPAPDLWLFFLLVFGIVVLPGLDMAQVLGSTLAGGRSAGFAAVAGITFGGLGHIAMGAAGLSALVALEPAVFNLFLVAGSAYLVYIGLSLVRHAGGFGLAPANGSASPGVAFRRGMVTNLLNPKAYAFS
ncbi:MAG: LysE family translocator, partial [Acidobacteria bacterium]|nr:LysE family translocator [Acidobacteriota bacterium]